MAHIDHRGDVVWLCWPRFDSSFIFGSLLDKDKGGEFSIRPGDEAFRSRQYYIRNTNVLVTEIESGDSAFRITDFAPRFYHFERYYKPTMLVRKIEPLRGTPRIRIVCRPVADYGKTRPEVQMGSNHIAYQGLGKQVRLTTDVPLNYVIEERDFVLSDAAYLALTYGPALEAPLEETADEFLSKTTRYWQSWVLRANTGSFFQEEIIRSALVLKLHQYDDTGAIIASGTTSLPESPGSGRTWDYRYCWMRDSYYALAALNNMNHFEELEHYASYIQNIASNVVERYYPVYSITGETGFREKIAALRGYLNNGPVRVGNDACDHVQNDVYGQVLVALLPLYIDRRFPNYHKSISIDLIYQLLHHIERTMFEPDAGIWEFRTTMQVHCYTMLFHWAGAAAAEKIALDFQDRDLLEKATRLRLQAIDQIEKCYDPERGVYTQAAGSPHLDASNLQLITMKYLDPNSERTRRHLAAIEKELATPEGLVYRYKNEDDFGRPEVTFFICAFWYVEALATVGRVDDATRVFEHLLTYSNHLGLFSEDVSSQDGSQWGNFPQTYPHIGLINAASRIVSKLDTPVFL